MGSPLVVASIKHHMVQGQNTNLYSPDLVRGKVSLVPTEKDGRCGDA